MFCQSGNGECVALLAPFAGRAGFGPKDVGVSEYCAALTAYYTAVATVGGGFCCGAGERSRDAGVSGGDNISRFVRRVLEVGGHVGQGVVGDTPGGKETDDKSGGVAECERSVEDEGESGLGRNPGVSTDADDVPVSGGDGDLAGAVKPVRGRHFDRNKSKRDRQRANRRQRKADSVVEGQCGSVSGGSVRTVDTRTGVEIEAAQTLAARRVAENNLAVKKAEAERLLVEHKIRALQDKSRTKAIEKLAATRMEEKINKSKKNSEEAFKQCEASLKSLGSSGSAGEFALKQQIKDARDNEAILKYVQEQNKIYARNASPEVLNAVSRVKAPVIQEEYDAFGDCPSDYDEDEAEAYNNDRNRRNDEMAQRLQGLDEVPLW